MNKNYLLLFIMLMQLSIAVTTLSVTAQSTTDSSITNYSSTEQLEEWFIGPSIKIDESGTVSYPRCRYRYIDEQSLFYELRVLTIPTGHTVNIYLPTEALTIIVQPAVGYSISGTTITISSTQVEEYWVTWTEKNRNLVAISEVTTDYLSDSSFEQNHYSFDWTERSTALFDSITIDNTTVFDGTYSLRLEDTESATVDVLRLKPAKNLPAGSYYISFNYYVKTAGSYARFYYYDLSTNNWKYYSLDLTTDRWHTARYYVELAERATTQEQILLCYIDEGVLLFDNVRIYQTNAQCHTTAYQENEISGKVISWDNRQDPGLSTNITVQLRIRANNTLIYERNLVTEENGQFSFVVSYSEFEPYELEYEIRVIVWNSWFGNVVIGDDSTTDRVDYEEGDTEGIIESFYGMSAGFSDGARYVDISDSQGYVGFREMDNYQSYQTDIVFVRWKANITDVKIRVFFVNTLTSDWWFYRSTTTDLATTSEYSVFIADFVDSEDDNYLNHYVGQEIDQIGWWFYQNGAYDKIRVYVDEVWTIQSQKSFFTPTNVESFSLQSWDLQFVDYDYSSYITNVVANGGYLTFTPDGSSTFAHFDYSISAIQPFAAVRVKANISNIVWCQFVAYVPGTGYVGLSTPYSPAYKQRLNTTWNIIVNDLTLDNEYSDSATRLGLWLYRTNYATLESNITIYVDFMRNYDIDTPTLHESSSYFFLSSTNNSYQSFTTLDNVTIAPALNDLELVWKNQSAGSHTFSYIVFNDLSAQECYLPSQEYSLTYTLVLFSNYNVTATLSTSSVTAGDNQTITVIVTDDSTAIVGAEVQIQLLDNSGTVLYQSQAALTDASGKAYFTILTNDLCDYNATITVVAIAHDSRGSGATTTTFSYTCYEANYPDASAQVDPIRNILNAITLNAVAPFAIISIAVLIIILRKKW